MENRQSSAAGTIVVPCVDYANTSRQLMICYPHTGRGQVIRITRVKSLRSCVYETGEAR